MNGPITSQGMGFLHNDTYGIVGPAQLSIPVVSDTDEALSYHAWMEKDTWKNWGKRFRELARDNGETLATVSEKMGRAESTLRSWTNSTREINLSEFFELCASAGVNPSQVLFGGVPMDPEIKRQVGELAKRVLDADPAVVPSYQKMTKAMRSAARVRK